MAPTERVVTARHPHHVWHVDLTVVPTRAGLWVPWPPQALPQVWPFCYWVAVALDHFSRCAVGFHVFLRPPTSEQVRAFLGRAIHAIGQAPRHMISDRGSQFDCRGFRRWCRRRGIRPRYGAVGRYGSIAIVERLIRSMKTEGIRPLVIPMRLRDMRRELAIYVEWYNTFRPHQSLGGRTPLDVCRRARSPPRRRARANSELPEMSLRVEGLHGRRHLPLVTLKRAA
jgi:putative transposase